MSEDAGRYMSGLASEFATEALPGALPEGRDSPYGCTAVESAVGPAFVPVPTAAW